MFFKNDWTRHRLGVLKKHLQFFKKSSSNDRKAVEKAKFSNFDNFGDFAQIKKTIC